MSRLDGFDIGIRAVGLLIGAWFGTWVFEIPTPQVIAGSIYVIVFATALLLENQRVRSGKTRRD